MDNIRLNEGEVGLVFNWGREDCEISLYMQEKDKLKAIFQESIKNPAFYVNGEVRKRGSLIDNLKTQMCRKMMLDEKSVEFMMIVGIGPANTAVWEKFYNLAERVLDQLLDGKDAEIRLEDYLASLTDVYTQEDFSKLLKPFYEEIKQLFKKKIEEQLEMSQKISTVFLYGEYTNPKFVEKWIWEDFKYDVCIEKKGTNVGGRI